MNTFIKNFRKSGAEHLDKMNEKQLISIIEKLNQSYHNTQNPLMSDNEYDIIREYTEKKYSSSIGVGAYFNKNKINLPYFMSSLDKIKPDTNALTKWCEKYSGDYVITPKLDGVSGLYLMKEGVKHLYTRGNGVVGQDISHLIAHMFLPIIQEGQVFRGEFVMQKRTYEEKYSNMFSNQRNMISGVINQKYINLDENRKNIYTDIEFLIHEVIEPKMRPSEQMVMISSLQHFPYFVCDTITNEILTSILLEQRNSSEYDIDGIVVKDNKIYEREKDNKNPKHSFAFKMLLTEQIAEAKIINIFWNASKDGYLKPRIQIEPIQLAGVMINYVTGFNGSYIFNHSLGIGSIIKITRSGDVIPHITEVIQASNEPLMPSIPYRWTESRVDIIVENVDDNQEVKEKNIVYFFKNMEVENISNGLVKKCIEKGFDTISKIVKMKVEDFLTIDGFKITLANKIFNSIQTKIKNASIVNLMYASNTFGRGISKKKIEAVIEKYPSVLNDENKTNEDKIKYIVDNISGFSIKTASLFVSNIQTFQDFMKQLEL